MPDLNWHLHVWVRPTSTPFTGKTLLEIMGDLHQKSHSPGWVIVKFMVLFYLLEPPTPPPGCCGCFPRPYHRDLHRHL